MTDNVQLGLIISLPPTIAAISALIVGVHNSFKSDKVEAKLDVVHELTNSNLSKVTNALAVAQKEIDGLKRLVQALAPYPPAKLPDDGPDAKGEGEPGV